MSRNDPLADPSTRRLALLNARILVPGPGGRELVESPSTALSIEGGWIARIGRTEAVRAALHADTDTVDLDGATVAPGFVDAHAHAFDCALNELTVSCLPPSVDSIAVIVGRLAERARSSPTDGWIVGVGYDDARLLERRHPTRDDLDAADPDRPVFLTRVCGHMSVANSRALELAGIGSTTPDPEGGVIVRDAAGHPTGLLLELAQSLVKAVIPPEDDDAIEGALARIGPELLARGITTIGEALLGAFHPREAELWRAAFHDGWVGPAVRFLATPELLYREDISDLPVIGTKLFADGVVTGRTACVDEPFEGSAERGFLIHEPDALTGLVAASIAHGLPVGIHSMGDRGIATALAAIVQAEAERSGAPVRGRHRIEHCTLPSAGSLATMGRHGIIPVPQPVFLFAEGEAYLDSFGPDRCARAYPLRTMVDAGLAPAVSSDAPATSWDDPLDPWLGVATAVVRRTWAGTVLGTSEAIGVGEALAAYTLNGAKALGLAERTGSVEVGKLADLLVFEHDPLTVVDVGSLAGMRPTAVLRGGDLVAGALP